MMRKAATSELPCANGPSRSRCSPRVLHQLQTRLFPPYNSREICIHRYPTIYHRCRALSPTRNEPPRRRTAHFLRVTHDAADLIGKHVAFQLNLIEEGRSGATVFSFARSKSPAGCTGPSQVS